MLICNRQTLWQLSGRAVVLQRGTIFVPTTGGISHSPLELTSRDDCVRDANVLLGAILELDRLDTV